VYYIEIYDSGMSKRSRKTIIINWYSWYGPFVDDSISAFGLN
jgi:hypothetical protein